MARWQRSDPKDLADCNQGGNFGLCSRDTDRFAQRIYCDGRKTKSRVLGAVAYRKALYATQANFEMNPFKEIYEKRLYAKYETTLLLSVLGSRFVDSISSVTVKVR
jgi:hypothetical protein